METMVSIILEGRNEFEEISQVINEFGSVLTINEGKDEQDLELKRTFYENPQIVINVEESKKDQLIEKLDQFDSIVDIDDECL